MADRPLSIDVRHLLMLKTGDLALLTREDGEIVEAVPGFGLFYRDTCYLASYALRLHGTEPLSLMSSDREGIAAQLTLTNHALDTANGTTIPDHTLTLRRTSLPTTVAPRTTESSAAHFDLSLQPLETVTLVTNLRVDERGLDDSPVAARPSASAEALREAQDHATTNLLDGFARVETPSEEYGQAIARSLSDLALLNTRRGPHRFTAAGVPWFVGLFGRDSLLPTLQCLALNPAMDRDTLRALVYWQGTKDDPKTREQPGTILHELRVGEMSHLHEVTQTPSYASVDSTPLFLIALGARRAQGPRRFPERAAHTFVRKESSRLVA